MEIDKPHIRMHHRLIGCATSAVLSCLLSVTAFAGPHTIAVLQGETLTGGGSNNIASETAHAGRTLKVSTAWPAIAQVSIKDTAYKLLVRGTGDACDGSPTLEVLINDEVILTETFHDKNWRLGIENINLPPGIYDIGARLKNPYASENCRRAVYMDVVYIEKQPSESGPERPAPERPSPSGEPMPIGDLPGWQQIFTDDFNDDVALGDFPEMVRDKWWAYPYPWRDTKGQRTSNPVVGGWYYPERTVSIANGVMNIWLHTEWFDGAHRRLVAAPVPKIFGADTSGTQGQLYGRYAIRFRADPVAGYKTAWLLWPDSGVHPRDGEIDFPEGDLTETIKGFMHWQNATDGSQQYYALSEQSYYDWHTAVIEWEADRVAFYLDDNLLFNASQGKSEWFDRIPNTPMHWVIQTETRLDNIQPAITDQGNVEIDWVAVWRKK